MTARELEEYASLRATIRERGTCRVWVFVLGVGVWGALTIAAAVTSPTPLGVLLPLLFLAALFEGVFALHTGVERVGRYIQVFYEGDTADPTSNRHWEQAAMAFGRASPKGATDPLFGVIFILGVLLNVVPALALDPIPAEWVVVGVAHVALIGRVLVARAHAATQRARDLEAFQALSR